MASFSFSFITTMMHSVWQMALLLLFYMLSSWLRKNLSPLFKRNFLYVLLGVQLLLSGFTFLIIYREPFNPLLPDLSLSIQHSLQNSWLASYAPVLYGIYWMVVVYRVVNAYVLWKHFKLDYKQTLLKPSIDLRLFTQTKIFQLGIKRKVSIWCSQHINSPLTFGFWKPVILLPIALVNKLSMEETEALIVHELTHIRNHDYLLNWLLLAVETLYFFNPFVRIVAQKIKLEREKNCDVQVLQFNYGTILYAETLHKTAQFQQIQLSQQLAAVANKKQLLERIFYFSNPKNLHFKRSNTRVAAGSFLLMLLINVVLALVFIQHQSIKNKGIDFADRFPPSIYNEPKSFKNISAKVHSEPHRTIRKKIDIQAVSTISTNEVKIKKEVAEENVSTTAPVYYAIAASNEDVVVEGKDMIINDVSSDGKKITAAYRALFINGVWTLQPLWMLSETKTVKDSLKQKGKDAVLHIIPATQ
ncbi:MAG: M56 family metallopeptidase [Ferruginibacter sp.]